MKFFTILLFFFTMFGCTSRDSVYWCGDHACINKKEKEDYFKEFMIVEVKDIKKSKKHYSDLEVIKKNVGLKSQNSDIEKSQIANKNNTNDEVSISNEKELAKKAFLKQKRLIEEEKEMAKEIKLEKKELKRKNKELKKQEKINEKKISKKKEIIDKNYKVASTESNSNTFNDIVKKINEKNSNKPFRDINDIP